MTAGDCSNHSLCLVPDITSAEMIKYATKKEAEIAVFGAKAVYLTKNWDFSD